MNHIDFKSYNLPIVDVLEEVKDCLKKNNTLIVSAPPGAGKSTLLPLAFIDAPWLKGKKILMLEPRRLAAKTIAKRMSDILGDDVGNTIGYRIRFETKVSTNTKIEVVTEGILTRMLQSDNALADIGMVIFDEYHERSIHADVSLALSRECQKILREDLRIVIMSATLNIADLNEKLGASVIESKGRQYPVEIIHKGEQNALLLPEMITRVVLDAIKSYDGDILVFLPGQGEIKRCEELLRNKVGQSTIYPLYGQLPFDRQNAAIRPDINGRRKIVLATDIAETSLTIEGVKVVIDSGFGRIAKFDHNSGLSRLETIQISKDSADQRAGRAGRLGPGTCIRLWTKATDLRLFKHRTPEIMQADLCSLGLDMAAWGVSDPYSLDWISPPPIGSLSAARETLNQLEALVGNRITEHGMRMNKLPCHPRIAHMLLEAEQSGLVSLASDIAALIEEKDPMTESGIDINERIDFLRKHRSENRVNRKWGRIEKVAQSYRDLFKIDQENDTIDPFETGFLLASAYPERIACAKPGNNAQFQLANGKIAMAHHKDDLAYESWLAIAHMNARDGVGKIFLASPLNPKDLAPLVKTKRIIEWDFDQDRLVGTHDLRIGSIILKSAPLTDISEEESKKVIFDVLKTHGEYLLDWNEEVKNLLNRIGSIRKWNDEKSWPDLSVELLLEQVEIWLDPYISGVRNITSLKKLDLFEIITAHFFSYEDLQLLNKLAPKSITVPSGSQIKIQYSSTGDKPILAARIQELFGQKETPVINNGNNQLLIHLLSPGFKPVQVTTDLGSFWSSTYFEVKKELKGRYPKHYWPEDPTVAEAVNGVKRNKN